MHFIYSIQVTSTYFSYPFQKGRTFQALSISTCLCEKCCQAVKMWLQTYVSCCICLTSMPHNLLTNCNGCCYSLLIISPKWAICIKKATPVTGTSAQRIDCLFSTLILGIGIKHDYYNCYSINLPIVNFIIAVKVNLAV